MPKQLFNECSYCYPCSVKSVPNVVGPEGIYIHQAVIEYSIQDSDHKELKPRQFSTIEIATGTEMLNTFTASELFASAPARALVIAESKRLKLEYADYILEDPIEEE